MGLIWVAIIIIAVLVDIFTSIFLFSGFSIGGIVALIMEFLGVPLYVQVIAFSIIGILFIVLVSPKIKKAIQNNKKNTVKTTEEQLVGREIIAEKDIRDEELMLFEGVYWTFKNNGQFIEKGDSMKVIAIDGNKIIVKK